MKRTMANQLLKMNRAVPKSASDVKALAGPSKFCISCGKSILKKAKFCPLCGGAQE